jgi:hypothetical protein
LWYRLAGEPDEPAELYDVEPWPAGLRIVNHLRIGGLGTGDEAYVSGGPGAVQYAVHGTLAADAGKEFIRAARPDPALLRSAATEAVSRLRRPMRAA